MDSTARERATMPSGTQDILNTRSLENAHRRLAELLQPGMRVLDIGCGTGKITHGIAEATGPDGEVVGIDVGRHLIDEARVSFANVPGLEFRTGDVYQLGMWDHFDIVTSARVFQWLSDPGTALDQVIAATRPGGRVLLLDYNHEKIWWEPKPPEEFARFYGAFLRWRADAGMRNDTADRLQDMFEERALTEIAVIPQHERTSRSDPDFTVRAGIWSQVAASRGHQMVGDGYLTENERSEAERVYQEWVERDGQSQTMYLLSVEGVR